ncbi:AAA family ATPase [Rhodococcus sp. USK10]|uniref:AAA family ATPase n=1 Tax=Rhodococcus sp. USK10 TaxID=2789739 RepID=UPI001C5D71D9|nr:AAA family ATPase [Rhodococcus sp. USK10]QYB05412.1 AAA family ATPase [Rhodococcus sp. USK10]
MPEFDFSQWSDDSLEARFMSGSTLAQAQYKPPTWAVPGVIPEGLVIFSGPPKVGKSFFMAGLATACAAGGTALNGIPVDQRPVLYLSLEDSFRRLQGRYVGVHGEIPDDLDSVVHAASDEVPSAIKHWLSKHYAQAPMVILDTLGKAMSAKRSGESDYARDYRVTGELKSIIDLVPGGTLIAVHHTRKMESEDFLESVSGTNGIAGAADTIIVLRRSRNESVGTVAITGRDVEEVEFNVTFDGSRWLLTGEDLTQAQRAAELANAKAGLGERKSQVLDFVSALSGPMKVADISDILGFQCRRYLNELAKDEKIANFSRGMYGPRTFPTLSVSTVQSPVPNVRAMSDVQDIPDIEESGGLQCPACSEPVESLTDVACAECMKDEVVS